MRPVRGCHRACALAHPSSVRYGLGRLGPSHQAPALPHPRDARPPTTWATRKILDQWALTSASLVDSRLQVLAPVAPEHGPSVQVPRAKAPQESRLSQRTQILVSTTHTSADGPVFSGSKMQTFARSRLCGDTTSRTERTTTSVSSSRLLQSTVPDHRTGTTNYVARCVPTHTASRSCPRKTPSAHAWKSSCSPSSTTWACSPRKPSSAMSRTSSPSPRSAAAGSR